MVNSQVIEGNWNDISGRLKEKWGQLTGNEWDEAEGQLDQLVGVIQRKTGEARENIEDFLEEVTGCEGHHFRQKARETVDQARETVEHVAQKARETAEQAAERAKETFRTGYDQAETHVQQHPGRSLAIAFGVGLAAGLILSIGRK